MSLLPEAPASAPSFSVLFSGGEGVPTSKSVLAVGVPSLGGNAQEVILKGAVPLGVRDGVQIFRSGRFLVGYVKEPVEVNLAAQSQRIYAGILKVCDSRHLYRMWNYVPRINAVSDGLEHYRAFCKGRSLAFEQRHGSQFQHQLPAASAVGTEDSHVDVIFIAGEAAPVHIENPEQIPAYHYPLEYGPRSPSFSRATLATDGGMEWIYVSGTAAIKGHATVAPGSLREQIDCTLDNLRLISRACGVGDELGRDRGWTRHFKVYLRHVQDYAGAVRALRGTLIGDKDTVCYLRADVCRAALNIEIEATLSRGA